ncbi:hypothetical protein VTI74DRAFT_10352 [Chaetomium olivicolor]
MSNQAPAPAANAASGTSRLAISTAVPVFPANTAGMAREDDEKRALRETLEVREAQDLGRLQAELRDLSTMFTQRLQAAAISRHPRQSIAAPAPATPGDPFVEQYRLMLVPLCRRNFHSRANSSLLLGGDSTHGQPIALEEEVVVVGRAGVAEAASPTTLPCRPRGGRTKSRRKLIGLWPKPRLVCPLDHSSSPALRTFPPPAPVRRLQQAQSLPNGALPPITPSPPDRLAVLRVRLTSPVVRATKVRNFRLTPSPAQLIARPQFFAPAL